MPKRRNRRSNGLAINSKQRKAKDNRLNYKDQGQDNRVHNQIVSSQDILVKAKYRQTVASLKSRVITNDSYGLKITLGNRTILPLGYSRMATKSYPSLYRVNGYRYLESKSPQHKAYNKWLDSYNNGDRNHRRPNVSISRTID